MSRQTIAIVLVTFGALFVIGVSSIAVVVAWVMTMTDDRIEFGNRSELYYSKRIEQQEAQAVADYLASMQEDLALEKQVSYRVDRVDGRVIFGAVILDGYEDDLLTMTFMLSLRDSISDICFRGESIDFYAYDEYFNVKRVLKSEAGLDAIVGESVVPPALAEIF